MSSDDVAAFAAACRQAAAQLRRLPADLRKQVAARTLDQVAAPLAGKVAAAAHGPYGHALATAVKARKLADPTIVIGGARAVVSGGASARQLVYGVEFGGGNRRTRVPASAHHRGYTRRSTRQFARSKAPFVFPAIEADIAGVLDDFAGIVMPVLDQAAPGG